MIGAIEGDDRWRVMETWRKQSGLFWECEDPFSAFIAGWISLVILSILADDIHGTGSRSDPDRKRVRRLFVRNHVQLCGVVEALPQQVEWLAKRKGTEYGDPMVDTQNRTYANQLSPLAHHWLAALDPTATLDSEAEAALVAELLNRVRNNLFHGRKDYNLESDRQLLSAVDPILLGCIREFVP